MMADTQEKGCQAENLQAILERERAEWNREREEFLLREAFWKAGGKDAEYLTYRYRGEARFGEDGQLQNGDSLAEKAKGEVPEQFFRRQLRFSGVKPREGGNPMPDRQEFAAMGYRQRAELWERDPELYKTLARRT